MDTFCLRTIRFFATGLTLRTSVLLAQRLEEVKVDLLRNRIKAIPQVLALSARRSLHSQIETLLKRFDGQSGCAILICA